MWIKNNNGVMNKNENFKGFVILVKNDVKVVEFIKFVIIFLFLGLVEW